MSYRLVTKVAIAHAAQYKVANHEPAIQLPHDPDKKPMVFYVNSQDDMSCNKKPSPLSTPATLT